MNSEEETYGEHLEKWRENRGCLRKQMKFRTRKLARNKARELTMTLKNGRLCAYKCDYCGNFHVGHNKFNTRKVDVKVGGTGGI